MLCGTPSRFAAGTIVRLDERVPYPAVQSMFDGLHPKGMQWYWQGDFVKDLSDQAIEAHLAMALSELSLMHLYPIDGAVHRVAKDATA